MRKKNSKKYELPEGVVLTVKGICMDHPRKRKALIDGGLSYPVRAVYETYNEAVSGALLMLEEKVRYSILEDIAVGRGYEKSEAAQLLSHNAYAERKCRLIYYIAKNLNFIENRV